MTVTDPLDHLTAIALLDPDQVFTALDKWIRQRPGLDPRNYGDGPTWNARAYRSECNSIAQDYTRAKAALKEARYLKPAKPDLLADAFRAYSGRLEWDPVKGTLSYTAGQYWPTEYRKAAASVLETYIRAWKQDYAAANPTHYTYTSISDVRAANEASGGCWFDKATLKYFKTRIESKLIAGRYFITSEHGPYGPRAFTVREAKPDGSINTIGEFQGYRTAGDARKAITAITQSHTGRV